MNNAQTNQDTTAQTETVQAKTIFKKASISWIGEFSGVLTFLAGLYYTIKVMIICLTLLASFLVPFLGTIGTMIAITIAGIVIVPPTLWFADSVFGYLAGKVQSGVNYVTGKISSFFKKNETVSETFTGVDSVVSGAAA